MVEDCPYPEPKTRAEVKSLEGYLYFVWEREAIRIARLNDYPAPWTRDKVLQQYKFTNIRRFDDRVTQWIYSRLILPNVRMAELWFTLLVARLINWPPTLQYLIEQKLLPCPSTRFDKAGFVSAMEERTATGVKMFSGAYMIYPTRLSPGRSKAYNLAEHILSGAIARAERITEATLTGGVQATVEELTQCFGVSSFMAGQVAADLSYSPQHLGPAHDLDTYAPLGPGSQRGLNYLLNIKPTHAWAQDDFNAELQILNRAITEDLDIADLTLHDVQNTLCEYGKYAAFKADAVRPKNLYRPETEF